MWGVYSISSHDGTKLEALPVHASVQIAELVRPDTEVVAMDDVAVDARPQEGQVGRS